jgi:hypothetical protein
MQIEKYVMDFIAPRPGINTEIEDWDDGLLNFGYEACEDPAPVALAATTLELAREEAHHHWIKWRSSTGDDAPKGYWIVEAGGQIVHFHVEPVGA